MLRFFVNNKVILTENNATILQACSSAGIEIPRFCYHPSLSVAANCRMCLVETDSSIKPIASCAIQPSMGMRVWTTSFFVKKARESVLEFLLLNHPLDCPICDQGGECDLQDQTLVFGSDRGRFYERKKAVKNFFSGWLVKTFMTRCIHCTRCVRFNSEIELENKLGALGRGSSMRISNYVPSRLNSGFSGNLIDLCPVGALVSKPYSFTARPWELRKTHSLDISDYLFKKITLDAKGQELKRVNPSTFEAEESFFLGDKARFFWDGLFWQRLKKPSLKDNLSDNVWKNTLYQTSSLYLKSKLFHKCGAANYYPSLYCEQEVAWANKLLFAQATSLNKRAEIFYFFFEAKGFLLLSKISSYKSSLIFYKKISSADPLRFYLVGAAWKDSRNVFLSAAKAVDFFKAHFQIIVKGFRRVEIAELIYSLKGKSITYG